MEPCGAARKRTKSIPRLYHQLFGGLSIVAKFMRQRLVADVLAAAEGCRDKRLVDEESVPCTLQEGRKAL